MNDSGPYHKIIFFIFIMVFLTAGFNHLAAETRKEINFPDILGYKTLKCDFHMHSVFSDGAVWPYVRSQEAWREGLDVIALTEHIEKYHDHSRDLPINHNRSYEIAAQAAKKYGLIVIPGAEITWDMPPGHFNALFLSDISKLDKKNFKMTINSGMRRR